MLNSSIWFIDRSLSGATTLGQSGPESDEEVLHIPQSSSITRDWPSDCLMSYPGHVCVGEGLLPLGSDAVGVFYSPSQLAIEYL